MIAHHSAKQFYPSAGWGYLWQGDPDRGTGREQPGSWAYSLLPYADQDQIWKMGTDGEPSVITHPPSAASATTGAYQTNMAAMAAQIPLAFFICPSRRQSNLYACPMLDGSSQNHSSYNSDAIPSTGAARSDYAANGGTNPLFTKSGNLVREPFITWGTGPGPTPDVLGGGSTGYYTSRWFTKAQMGTPTDMDMDALHFNGICAQRTEIRQDDVVDGTSQTYMVGEKYVNPQHYLDGLDQSDCYTLLTGTDVDMVCFAGAVLTSETPDSTVRSAGSQTPLRGPMKDQMLRNAPNGGLNAILHNWGSAHPGAFNVAMCDGAVRQINYVIDPSIHDLLANRNDRQTIDPTKIGL
jgi:prepilin-type processing-associated H-X9-DG protein